MIQLRLHSFKEGNADPHNAIGCQTQKGNGNGEDQSTFDIDQKGHDNRTEDNEGTAKQEAKSQVQTGLYLVDITGQSGDQGITADLVHSGIRKSQNMIKDRLSQFGRKTDAGFCRKELGGNTEGKTDGRQSDHIKNISDNEGTVSFGDADVDDPGHKKGRDQIHERFCHLKRGGKKGFFFVSIEINH